jgi:hypothetical protein
MKPGQIRKWSSRPDGAPLAAAVRMAWLERRKITRLAAVALAVVFCGVAAAPMLATPDVAPALMLATAEGGPADFARAALDRRAPIVAERSYRLKAGVRLLLFWVHSDNVGQGRLTWRAGGENHRVLEFLVGSDPERAPRHINRWGFIAEEVRPGDADLLGIMSKSDEESVDDAKAKTEAEGESGSHPYRGIRTAIRGGVASGGVFRFVSAKPLTYRDLDTVLSTIHGDVDVARTVTVPNGTRPGFLFAVEDLIVSTLDQCRAGSKSEPPSVSYIYNNTFYTLRLRDCDFDTQRKIGDREFSDVIRAQLETRNMATGNRTSFRLEYGAAGDLKAVPLRIVFRPKWWFEAELLLDEQRTGAAHR